MKTEEIRLSEPVTEFDDIEGGSRIIGQERAMSLLSLGLSIDRVGYNIFLSGDDGSGREEQAGHREHRGRLVEK